MLAAVFVAEIGDVTRFDHPSRLCSWAGLTPRHRQSDTHIQRGRITSTSACSCCAGPPWRRSPGGLGPPDRRREGPHRCPPKDEELPRGLVSVGRTASGCGTPRRRTASVLCSGATSLTNESTVTATPTSVRSRSTRSSTSAVASVDRVVDEVVVARTRRRQQRHRDHRDRARTNDGHRRRPFARDL